MPKNIKVSSRTDKLVWLLRNPQMWAGWEGEHDRRKRNIVERMMDAGLVSRGTYWKDIGLTNMIHDARKLRLEK